MHVLSLIYFITICTISINLKLSNAVNRYATSKLTSHIPKQFSHPKRGMSDLWRITSSHSVEPSHAELKKYEQLMDQQMKKYDKKREEIEWHAFHGTCLKNAKKIIENGFNPEIYRPVWFSSCCTTSTWYAAQFPLSSNIPVVFLCKVIAANPQVAGIYHDPTKVHEKYDSNIVPFWLYDEEFPTPEKNNAKELSVSSEHAIPIHYVELTHVNQLKSKNSENLNLTKSD